MHVNNISTNELMYFGEKLMPLLFDEGEKYIQFSVRNAEWRSKFGDTG